MKFARSLRHSRKLIALASLCGALAALCGALAAQVQVAPACSHIPFKSYVSMVTAARDRIVLPPADRDELNRHLGTARNGPGPLWLGERQYALNLALLKVGLPAATRGPEAELTPEQRETLVRQDAEELLPQIEELQVEHSLTPAETAEVGRLKAETSRLVANHKWREAIATGNRALLLLGVLFPRC